MNAADKERVLTLLADTMSELAGVIDLVEQLPARTPATALCASWTEVADVRAVLDKFGPPLDYEITGTQPDSDDPEYKPSIVTLP